MTREPTGHPEADGARDPSRPPRPQPPRAATGPFPRAATGPMPRAATGPMPRAATGPMPRAATGPMPRAGTGPIPRAGTEPIPRAGTGPLPRAATGPIPRVPAAPDPAGRDPWSGTAPGFEFEGRRSRPRQGPQRTRPGRPGRDQDRRSPDAPREQAGRQAAGRDPAGGEPRFRYTPTVSQPLSAPTQAWPDDDQLAMPGFEFDDLAQNAPAGALPLTREPGPRQSGPRQSGPRQSGPRQSGPRQSGPRQAPEARPDLRAASTEWAGLLRSLLPQPAKRRWSQEFRAGLEFRGWWAKVAIPILAMVVFGVAVVVIVGANSGNSGPAPSATALGFPPATLAGNDFMVADSGRGIRATLGRVTSVGDEIVAVGSQAGARIARAQFFVSLNDGRSWTMGTVRSAGGGVPPPGHGAIFVAGGQGAWVALGPGSIWTSADGRTWTLAPGTGLPLLPGDQISGLARTAAGFIAVGANVPGGDQARSTPLIFLSANGITWDRLDAARLGLAAGGGRVLNVKYVAAAGKLILIAGDVATTEVTGKPERTVTVRVGAAWLSGDGGSTWAPTAGTAAGPALAPPGPGAQPQVTGVAAVGNGFILLRPATVARRPAVDVFYSPNGAAWTFTATLGAAAGFAADLANGGPDGAVVTGVEGRVGGQGGADRTLTAFVSANGRAWQQRGPLGSSASQALSGVALAPEGTVVTAGISAGQDSRRPVLTLAGPNAVDHVDIAKIPGAVAEELAVNGLAAQASMQVAVGSADGFPAAWTSVDGGISWTRATGGSPAVLDRPGSQQLTSVTHGSMGWLAVGGVTASAAEHPVVVVSANGTSWQAADGEAVFGAPGLFTEQAAADAQGYVVVGYQNIRQAQNGLADADHTVAAAWWSAGLSGWQRAGDATAGALDGPGTRQMMAVTASSAGFVAVGSHGDQPSAWTSADGRSWRQADLPLPVGSTRAVLQHVASTGRTVAAVGTAFTTTGVAVPFAASSSDGGATWIESALPLPAGLTSVTALAAAGGAFTATGTYGSTPGHQNVVVWTSPNGSAWRAAEPSGQGLTGPGIQAITSLTVSGSTLTGVGFTASPAGEEPIFWQSPIR